MPEVFLESEEFKRRQEFDPYLDISETTYELHKDKDLDEIIEALTKDISNYHNMYLAGILLSREIKDSVKPTYLEHLHYMEGVYREDFAVFVETFNNHIDRYIEDYDWCNYLYDYTSMSILIKQYLIKRDQYSEVAETPVMMYMRCAIALFCEHGLERVLQCFTELCQQQYTLASPQMFSCGKHKQQMSSCFVCSIDDDTEHIFETSKRIGLISVFNGGLGIDFSELRSSEIRNEGFAKGPLGVMRMHDSVLDWTDRRERKGAGTATLNVWNLKIQEFIDSRRKNIDHHVQVEILNTSVSLPWLFFDRVTRKEKWTLFDSKYTRTLFDLHGKDFEELYIRYERDDSIPPQYKKSIDAYSLLLSIVTVWRQAGMPYAFFRDSVNAKSNHIHIGPIKHSNLCMEITLRDSPDEINVCNLMSINLSAFVQRSRNLKRPSTFNEVRDLYDYESLAMISRSLVDNLNQVIDKNVYPKIEVDGVNIIDKTNKFYRAIGIGVSGLADCFFKMDLTYTDEYPSREFDESIFACMYYNAVFQSIQQAILYGKCDAFDGSPYSQGKFQFDLWREEYNTRYNSDNVEMSKKVVDEIDGDVTIVKETIVDTTPLDPSVWRQNPMFLIDTVGEIIDQVQPTWEDLRRVMILYGMRNSMLMALPPTASSSRLIRNCESTFLPVSNILSINVLSGTYYLINRHMIYDLEEIELWNRDVYQYIIANSGKLTGLCDFLIKREYTDDSSLFGLSIIERVKFLERKYTVMWNYKQKESLIRNARRGKYICQSQSANIYFEDPSDDDLVRTYLFANKIGIKTMYYLRMLTKASFQNFTIDKDIRDSIVDGSSEDTSSGDSTSLIESTYRNPLLTGIMECEGGECLSCSG